MIEDPDRNVRWTAIYGLGQLADKESVATIRPILLKIAHEDKEPKVSRMH